MGDRDTYIDAARRLKAAREKRGLTQHELAEAAGCSQSQVSAVERARFEQISNERLLRVFDVLGLAPDDLPGLFHQATKVLAYCDQWMCMMNTPVEGFGPELGVVTIPRFIWVPEGSEAHCPSCGHKLICRCKDRACKARVDRSIYCRSCGKPRIDPVSDLDGREVESIKGLTNAQQRAFVDEHLVIEGDLRSGHGHAPKRPSVPSRGVRGEGGAD